MNISISTAHNVDIDYTPAGVLDRIWATVIDLFFLFGIVVGTLIIYSAIADDSEGMWFFIILFSVVSIYHLFCEVAFNGRSIGKLTMNLQVVKLNGKKLTFWDCMLRWVFRLVDISLSFGSIALISIVVSQRMQRLGDLAAGTTVIQHEKGITLQQMSQYDAPEEYQIVFQQAALLSDKDIKIIKDVLNEVNKSQDYTLLMPLSLKIKEVTGIETNMIPLEFVQTILKDYTQLANN